MVALFLFIISLILIVALVCYRAWQIRAGRVVVEETLESWPSFDHAAFKQSLREYTKATIHHGALLALKLWIRIAYWVRKQDKRVHDKLLGFLHRGAKERGEGPSKFLEHIKEYKAKIQELEQAPVDKQTKE